ncbi:hypothetical protein [Aquabacterium sp.]|uniref:hypothetical protein n=1 Tax=Aquabacterium sp. TaxID=1872578 RepID=UPI00198CF71F|nr:hypothetical protein [Aquabacterium sp.]MBC7699078.1 hypothetical protein [Aquabacterium sp.]
MLMIKKQRSKIVWVVGGAVVAMLGGAYYASRTHSADAQPTPPHVEAYAKMLDSEPPAAADSSSGTHDLERPADIDPKEWQQLVDALRNHPQRDQELKRLVGYLRFKRDMDKWTALKDQPNALERAQVGQRILDALPVRFANQEVTGPEALMLQAAIYADMIPDEAQRRPMEEAARQSLMRALEHDAAMDAKLKSEDAQTADYKEREAVIMKRFKDQLIDQGQMEKELDVARVAAYQ